VNGELSPWFEVTSRVRQSCVLAPDLFLEPVDWIIHRSVHGDYLDLCSLRPSLISTLLTSLRASMLEIVVVAFNIPREESSQLGLKINCTRTNIQAFDIDVSHSPKVSVVGQMTRLSTPLSILDHALVQLEEAYSRIKMTLMCMKALSRSIVLLCQLADQDPTLQYVYTPDTPLWCRHVEYDVHTVDDAFDQWHLRHILLILHAALNEQMSQTTKSDAGPANRQPLFSLRQHCCVYSTTLFDPAVRHSTAHVLSERPLNVSCRSGNAREVDQDETGFERLRSTSSNTYMYRGLNSAQKPAKNRFRWRHFMERLCPAKDALLDQ